MSVRSGPQIVLTRNNLRAFYIPLSSLIFSQVHRGHSRSKLIYPLNQNVNANLNTDHPAEQAESAEPHLSVLLRGLTIERPNHVFGIDITYIRLRQGWMYLVAVLDWYSRCRLAAGAEPGD